MAQGDLRGNLTASVNSITNPTNLTGSVAVSVGDLVYVAFSQQTSLTASGVTDNLGNTYAAVNAGNDGGMATHRAFYARVTVAGTLTTVSVAATASTTDASGVAAVIEGPFLPSPLDANPANTSDGTTPFQCPATGTLAQADEVIMASIGVAANTTVAATSPFTISGTVARANISTGVSRQRVSATTTQTPEFTGTSGTAIETTASFKLAKVITADAGSFAVTGAAATLKFARKIVAEANSYAIAGTAASLELGREVLADASSYAVTGTAASLEFGREIAADPGSFAVTGTDAVLYVGQAIVQENLWPNSEVLPFDVADSVNVTLSSNSVVAPDGATTAELVTESTDGSPQVHTFGEFSLDPADQVTLTPGNWYAFSFHAKAVTGTRNLLLRFYDTTGNTIFSVTLDTTTGAADVAASDGFIGEAELAFSTAAANGYWRVGVALYFPATLTGGWGYGEWGTGTWGDERTGTVDPITLNAIYGELRDGTSNSYTGNGSSVAFWGFQVNRGTGLATYSKTPSSGRTLAADAGSYAVSGQSASLELGREALADAGSFSVTGQTSNLEYGREVLALAESYAISGTAASLELGREATADAGSYSVSGVDAALERGFEVLALSGEFTVTGQPAALEWGREALAGAGSFTINGVDASLERGLEIAAGAGAFALSGVDAGLEYGRELAAGAGSYVITGTDAGLVLQGANKTIIAEAGAFAITGDNASLERGSELSGEAGSFTYDGTSVTLEYQQIAVVTPTTGGGGTAAPTKDDWWRSPPKKKSRKARKTDTGAPTEAPLSVAERAERRRTAEEALKAAQEAVDTGIRNKVAKDALTALKTEARQRARMAAKAKAAADAAIEQQRIAAIIAEDDMILLLAA